MDSTRREADMPYKTSGCLVIFDDGMTELEIYRAETYKTADNIAANLNDALRWRKLCALVDRVPNGSVVCMADQNNADKYSLRVSEDPYTDIGIDNGHGKTLSEAIDAL